ncbi:MAG: hypothetical protein P9M15_01850 [Candidatus Electryoneaceae bacterium]|nr:hypothetical protein [Candidatus Electryoneaceae bacterium]
MTIFLILILGLVGIAMIVLAALLLPRVRFLGEYNSITTVVEIRSLLFRAKFDRKRKLLTGHFLFFLRWKRKILQPTESSEQSPADDPFPIEEEPETSEPEIQEPAEKPPKTGRKWKAHRKHRTKRKSSSVKGMMTLLWQERTLFQDLIKFVVSSAKRFISALQIEYLSLEMLVATPDPMTTGILFGALVPLTALNRPPRRTLNFQIDFQQDYPSFDISCVISIRPTRLIYIAVAELLHLPWRRMWKTYRKIRTGKSKSVH